jgi:hypothetical protein
MFVDVAVEACNVPLKRQLWLFYGLEIKLNGSAVMCFDILQSEPMAVTIEVGNDSHSIQDLRHFESDLETTS